MDIKEQLKNTALEIIKEKIQHITVELNVPGLDYYFDGNGQRQNYLETTSTYLNGFTIKRKLTFQNKEDLFKEDAILSYIHWDKVEVLSIQEKCIICKGFTLHILDSPIAKNGYKYNVNILMNNLKELIKDKGLLEYIDIPLDKVSIEVSRY